MEFSTDKAGQDVTPLNLEFGEEDKQHKTGGGPLTSIAGNKSVVVVVVERNAVVLFKPKVILMHEAQVITEGRSPT